MNKSKRSIKLVTRKHLIWVGITIIIGVSLWTYVLREHFPFHQLIFAIVATTILAVAIVALITYFANRPEKEE